MTPQDLRAIAQRAVELDERWKAYDAEVDPLWTQPIDDAKLQAAIRRHAGLRMTARPTETEATLATALLAAMDREDRVWNEAIDACVAALWDTDVAETGGGHMRQDDGSGTLANARRDVLALKRAALHREPEERRDAQ